MNFKSLNLASMPIAELSRLHDEVRTVLAQRLEEEKGRLEDQLSRLSGSPGKTGLSQTRVAPDVEQRRPYPPVYPKFRNPQNPSETWAGRGKQPRWLVLQLKAGKKVEDFLIKPSDVGAKKTRRARH